MVAHEFFLLITNAFICTGIAIRVVTFRRNGSQHRRWGGWLAYFLIVAAASIPVRVAGNDSNLLIVFYVQIMPDDFVMQLHRF